MSDEQLGRIEIMIKKVLQGYCERIGHMIRSAKHPLTSPTQIGRPSISRQSTLNHSHHTTESIDGGDGGVMTIRPGTRQAIVAASISPPLLSVPFVL